MIKLRTGVSSHALMHTGDSRALATNCRLCPSSACAQSEAPVRMKACIRRDDHEVIVNVVSAGRARSICKRDRTVL